MKSGGVKDRDGMKDAGQKDLLYRHFRAQGWFAVVEVPLFHRGGYLGERKLITDADVLALRASPDLHWEYVVGDCKTKRSESPANRALWVRSLMDHFSASRGIVLLRREKYPIEADHKLFAHTLGVTLLDDAEFGAYDRAVVYPAGSSEFPESTADLRLIREDVPRKFPGLSSLAAYLRTGAWNEPDALVMMRKVIAAGRVVHREIDPEKVEHLGIVLEAAALFAIGFAACVGTVFHQYLQPNERATLNDALRVLIWGGRDQYDYIARLRRRIIEAKGGGTDDAGDLALPDWDAFTHLVRSHLDAPRLAFKIPQLLRMAAIDVVTGRPFIARYGSEAAMLVKLAMLVGSYYAQASLFPQETKARIRELFVRRMSDVAVGRDTAAASPSFAVPRDGEVGASEVQEELPYRSGRLPTTEKTS